MPTRNQLDTSIIALITPQSGGDKVTSADHRQANDEILDYVDQQDTALASQIAALPTTSEMDTAISDALDAYEPPSSNDDFEEHSGSTWDGTLAYRTLTANLSLTLTTALNSGVFYVKQNGTGGWTFTIEGEELAINTTADKWSAVGFNRLGDEIVFSVNDNIIAIEAPETPTLDTVTFSADAISDTEIDLTSIVSDAAATGMIIRRATNVGMSAGLTTIYTGTPKSSHSDTGLTESTHYYYDIVTSAPGYNNSVAGTDDDTTDAAGLTPLNAPTSFAAGTPTEDGVPFTWVDTNTSPAESSGLIQITTAADTGYAAVVATRTPAANATSAAAGTGLTADTDYRARMKFVGNGTTTADSSYSTEVTFTTDEAAASAPTVSSKTALATANQVTVVFDISTSGTAAGWSIKVNGGSNIAASAITGAGTSRTLTVPDNTVVKGATITISYDSTTGDTVGTVGGVELVTFSNAAVTNNSKLLLYKAFDTATLSPFQKHEVNTGTVTSGVNDGGTNKLELDQPGSDIARAYKLAVGHTIGTALNVTFTGVNIITNTPTWHMGDYTLGPDASNNIAAGTNTVPIATNTHAGTDIWFVPGPNTQVAKCYIAAITIFEQ